jgi:hypothetical protein
MVPAVRRQYVGESSADVRLCGRRVPLSGGAAGFKGAVGNLGYRVGRGPGAGGSRWRE